jgi:hypothetical protein
MRSGTWSHYSGGGAIILAVVLFLVTGALLYVGRRLPHPIPVKRPGRALGIALVALLALSIFTFLVAADIYAQALIQQRGHLILPGNPITPVTFISAVVAFFFILYLAQRGGFRVAVGSAIVGTIAAPMIFELPFDLIVMWHTYPPTPQVQFTLLYFLPLFLIEVSSFTLLSLSPIMKMSRYTCMLLASMFLVFAVWALFGFAYPSAPLPIALNAISKVLAFATAVSLFFSDFADRKIARTAPPQVAPTVERTPTQAPYSSGLT